MWPQVEDRERTCRRDLRGLAHARDEILDRDVRLGLRPIAEYLETVRVPQQLDDKVMDDAMIGSRSDRVPEPEGEGLPAVQVGEPGDDGLPRQLGSRVVGFGLERAVAFCRWGPRRAPVHDTRRRVPQLPDVVLQHGLADDLGGDDPGAEVPSRQAIPTGDVGAGGQMHDPIVTRHRGTHDGCVRRTATDEGQAVRLKKTICPIGRGAGKVVQDCDRAAVRQERGDQLSADEPSATCDERPGCHGPDTHPGHLERRAANLASKPCQRPARNAARHSNGIHSTEYS